MSRKRKHGRPPLKGESILPAPVGAQALRWLAGAFLQRVDRPDNSMFCLGFRVPGNTTWLLLCAGKRGPWVGSCEERPRGQAADAHTQRLRKHLLGTRLQSSYWDPETRTLSLGLNKSEQTWQVSFCLDGRTATILPVLRGPAPMDAPNTHPATVPQDSSPTGIANDSEDLARDGRRLQSSTSSDANEQRRSEIARQLKAKLRRLRKRDAAIRRDMERARDCASDRARASLLLSKLHELQEGVREFSLLDESMEPPRQVKISLTAGLTAVEQANRWFNHARRMERGLPIARERLTACRDEIDSVEKLLLGCTPDSEIALADLERMADACGIRKAGDRKSQGVGTRQTQRREPYRSFTASTGHTIRVGRSARDNDALTVGSTRPWDLWLHARGVHGAHVVISLARDEACPNEALLDAATLAAHFSECAGSAQAEIQYASRRHIRKLRGSAPGSIAVDREKVILLRIEAARIRQLLATERQC